VKVVLPDSGHFDVDPDSNIQIEVWLPYSGWNRRYLGVVTDWHKHAGNPRHAPASNLLFR